jgi:MFS family permease
MKKSKQRDIGQVLIYAALIVMVARYMGAFLASDMNEVNGWVSDLLTGLIAISGAGMGVLDVLGAAFVFDGWRSALPRSGAKWSARFRVLTVIVGLMFSSGIVILVPFTMSRVLEQPMSGVLVGGWLWVWAVAVNLAPYLLIGGVMFSQNGILPKGSQKGINDAESDANTTQKAKRTQVYRKCACGYVAENRYAWSGHARGCALAREASKDEK